MTTHNEHREELVRDLKFAGTSVYANIWETAADWAYEELAEYLTDAGWRKQGAAHPDVIERAREVVAGVLIDKVGQGREQMDRAFWTLEVDAMVEGFAEAGLLAGQGAADDEYREGFEDGTASRGDEHQRLREAVTEIRSILGVPDDVNVIDAVRDLAAGQGAADDCDGCTVIGGDAEAWQALQAHTGVNAEMPVGEAVTTLAWLHAEACWHRDQARQGAADDDTTRLRAEPDWTSHGPLTAEEKLDRLRAENEQLRVECDALRRAIQSGQIIRERDDLQARIDKALSKLNADWFTQAQDRVDGARRALTEASQPQPEPERCSCGGRGLTHLHSDEHRPASERAEVSRPQEGPEHADDCQGCDGPNDVPCAADEVRGDVAYRNGEPIKRLKPEWDTYERVAREVSRPQEGPKTRRQAHAELSYESARDGTDDESNHFPTTR